MMTNLRRRIAVLWTLGVLALASVTTAQFMEPYRNGLNALEDGRLKDAERYFRRAIRERADEKIRLGLDYLPHYYLGVTLARQNRCAEALQSWSTSERQGHIQKAPKEGPDLAGRVRKCTDRVRALEAAQRAAEQAVAQARKAEKTLVELRDSAEQLAAVWDDGSPSFRSREQAARQQLQEADRRLAGAAGAVEVGPFQQARSLANRAAADFDQLRSEAETRLEDLRDAASSALERLETAEKAARSVLSQVRFLRPYPSGLGSRVNALQSALDATVEEKAEAPADRLGVLQRTLAGAARELREAAQGPPQDLLAAAEAFLAGRYEEVIATLDGTRFQDRRASGQACLLRSAARHAVYVAGGEADFEMGTALYEDVLGCQDLVPAAQIRTTFFSPRFIRFYEAPTEPPPAPEDPGLDLQDEDSAAADEAAPETG